MKYSDNPLQLWNDIIFSGCHAFIKNILADEAILRIWIILRQTKLQYSSKIILLFQFIKTQEAEIRLKIVLKLKNQTKKTKYFYDSGVTNSNQNESRLFKEKMSTRAAFQKNAEYHLI